MPEQTQHFALEWLDRHGDRLFSYASARLGDATLAEDLVQETLLAAIKAWPQFNGQSAVETWLIGILRRKIIDRYRATSRRPLENSTESLFDSRGSLREVAAWGRDAAEDLETLEFKEVFDRCLAQLKPDLAEAFTLCVMDGLSTQQACSILGVTPTNLSVRLHRARVTLRKLLQTHWFEDR